MSSMSKVSSKGQVVIPMEIRKTLGIEEGDHLRFDIDEEGGMKIKVVKKSAILNLFGVAKPRPHLDTSDLTKVVRESYEERMEKRIEERNEENKQ